MFNNFLSIFGDVVATAAVLVIALVLTIPPLLGFLFSFVNSRTRFKKLGAILWIILMIPILGISILAIWNGYAHIWGDNWRDDIYRFFFIAGVPLFLCASWFGRFFNRKKKTCWLVFPVIFAFEVVLVSLMFWAVEAKPLNAYQDHFLSKEDIEKSEGYDFDFKTLRGSNYETAVLRIRGRGDSVYYRIYYYLCPFALDNASMNVYVLDNGVLSANFIKPLKKNVTPWTLLDKEKSSIAIKLRNAIMAYENEMTIKKMDNHGPVVSFKMDDFKKGIHRSMNFFIENLSIFPEANAISEMEESLWPPRETLTNYSDEQAEKACRDSQNFTGELGD